MSDPASITRSRASAHSLAFHSSNSSTSESLWSAESDVDNDGFLQSSFRAGGPVLTALPAYCVPIGRAYSVQNDIDDRFSEIYNQVSPFLTEYQIPYFKFSMIGRISRVKESEPIPTVLVDVDHVSPPQSALWREAARKIHAKLSPLLPDISVELIDEKLARRPHCYPVEPSHPIIPKWDDICNDILRVCDVCEWTGVACWRYGVEFDLEEFDPEDNPVTIIVSVLESAVGPFASSLQQIRDILAEYSVDDVDILFMKNERHSHYEESQPDPVLCPEACSRYVLPGVGIGIQNSSTMISTLGGIVELKFPNDPAWYPYGLTCFHGVYPPSKHRSDFSNIEGASEAFASWEFQPVCPGDKMAKKLRLEQPSCFDIRNTIAKKDEVIRDFEKGIRFQELHTKVQAIKQGDDDVIMFRSDRAWYEAQVRDIEAIQDDIRSFQKFIDNGSHKMGHVYAGSGLYRALFVHDKPRMSDWALIEIDRERVPASDDLYEKNKPPPSSQESRPLSFRRGTLRGISSGDELCKSGRTTASTCGWYSGIREVNITRVRDPTRQEGARMVITWDPAISSNNEFAEPGDSGSLIYTNAGKVVGMLVGGNERLPTWTFSPIEDVFEDIKTVTRAEDVRLPIPT